MKKRDEVSGARTSDSADIRTRRVSSTSLSLLAPQTKQATNEGEGKAGGACGRGCCVLPPGLCVVGVQSDRSCLQPRRDIILSRATVCYSFPSLDLSREVIPIAGPFLKVSCMCCAFQPHSYVVYSGLRTFFGRATDSEINERFSMSGARIVEQRRSDSINS